MERIIAMLLTVSSVCAADFYHKKYSDFYYHDTVIYAEKKKKNKNDGQVSSGERNFTKELQAYKKAVKESLAKAMILRTKEAVRQYQEMQTNLLQMSGEFAEIWQYNLTQHRELNYEARHPVNQIGLEIAQQMDNEKKKEIIGKIADQYDILFVWKPGCEFCKRMEPIIHMLMKKYDFAVCAVNLEGDEQLEGFAKNISDSNLIPAAQLVGAPGLALLHRETAKFLPLSLGFRTLQEIEENFITVYNGEHK